MVGGCADGGVFQLDSWDTVDLDERGGFVPRWDPWLHQEGAPR